MFFAYVLRPAPCALSLPSLDVAAMNHIPAPAVFTCAALGGLLVLFQAFHPWTRSLTPRRQILTSMLSLLYAVAVIVTSYYWINSQKWSHLALRLLLEFSWLNGVAGQVRLQIHL
jgi:hypothetical protein